MADQLCTVAAVKARIGITDATDDAVLAELVEGVSAWLQDETHRRLLPDNGATYTFDTSSGSVIAVPRGIRAVTAVELAIGDQPDTGGAYTAISVADVLLRPLPIDRRYGWPADRLLLRGTAARIVTGYLAGARVTGDYDFAATPLPIRDVAIDAVVSAYAARGRPSTSTIGADAFPVPSWAQFFSRGSPQRATVDRYRAGIVGMA